MAWYDGFDNFAANNSNWFAIGTKFLSAGFQYSSDNATSDAKRKWQQYSNAMTHIADANNQGVITQNEQMAISTSVNNQVSIEKGGLLTEAKSEVAAAAAGVKGRSVTQSLLDIQSNASQREQQRRTDLNNTLIGFNQQRYNSKMSAAVQQDYSYIPKPSASMAMFGAGLDSFQYLAKLSGKDRPDTGLSLF